MKAEIPLIPNLAKKYFIKAKDKNYSEYYKALDIRICLEKICDLLFIHLITEEEKCKWKKYTLHNKLSSLKTYYPNSIIDDLLNAKSIGNKGAHIGEESLITKNDIDRSLKAICKMSKWTFIIYFKKYGFGKEPWMAVVFSFLPPIYRVEILEVIFNTNKDLIIIDKLSMAYLKAGMENKSYNFIIECFEKKIITEEQKISFIEKLDLLKTGLPHFNIAKSVEESKINFEKFLESIPENERGLFVVLMSIILM